MELTERRHRICSFLAEFAENHPYGPTIRQIGAGVGISSTSVVTYNLNALERLGAIRRERNVSRSIVLSPGFRVHAKRAAGRPQPRKSGAALYAQ